MTNAVTLVLLSVKGDVPQDMVWGLVPVFVLAALLGNAVGLGVARRMSTTAFRSVVIALVIVAGAATLIPS
ncbi:hypothetical protein ACFVKB_07915 [Rhodococcus sp. NPDC127530]|uniref:hypothetical protein n=1 Tax=unclassified Rhodococcus (in: high G+C Gram-positive bacteria) TaxID=192944 RepID=UPI0036308C01